MHGGNAVAAALFAGGDHDFLPAFYPFLRALAAEFDDAAAAGYRKNIGNTQLYTFLQGEIHALAAGYGLNQLNGER